MSPAEVENFVTTKAQHLSGQLTWITTEEIDGKTFNDMTEQDFKDEGIEKMGMRRTLLQLQKPSRNDKIIRAPRITGGDYRDLIKVFLLYCSKK